MTLCQSCVDVWEHWKDGLHGKGDPAEEVIRLRARIKALELAMKETRACFGRPFHASEWAESWGRADTILKAALERSEGGG